MDLDYRTKNAHRGRYEAVHQGALAVALRFRWPLLRGL